MRVFSFWNMTSQSSFQKSRATWNFYFLKNQFLSRNVIRSKESDLHCCLWYKAAMHGSIFTMCIVDADAGNCTMPTVLHCSHCLWGSNYTQSAVCVLDLKSAVESVSGVGKINHTAFAPWLSPVMLRSDHGNENRLDHIIKNIRRTL